jgi:hypothetical protein
MMYILFLSIGIICLEILNSANHKFENLAKNKIFLEIKKIKRISFFLEKKQKFVIQNNAVCIIKPHSKRIIFGEMVPQTDLVFFCVVFLT